MGKKSSKPQIKGVPKSVSIDTSNLENVDYPVFCFKYLQTNSWKKCTSPEFYRDFLTRLCKLSELGWKGIGTSPRHTFGTEKIPKSQIIPKSHPSIITPEVDAFTVFRANGDNRPFLGVRGAGNIFHVIYIEAKFGEIYKHR